jgi:hypothetical protein
MNDNLSCLYGFAGLVDDPDIDGSPGSREA